MSHISLYPDDFPKQFRIKEVDVTNMVQTKDWDALNDVVICRDNKGNVTARFEQNIWDLIPIARSIDKNCFNFEFLNDSLDLQIEYKLLAYGWLHHKSCRNKVPKLSSLIDRMSKIRTIYSYLNEMGANSLSYLSETKHQNELKEMLREANYSQNTLSRIFWAINHAIALEPWLQFSFGFKTKFLSSILSRELSDREAQQTLVIPERLSDIIYSKAITLINNAHPNKELIANIECELQKNYLEGKRILEVVN